MTTDESTIDLPADAGERLRDAEAALATFYQRIIEAERELAANVVRADTAEARLAEAEAALVARDQRIAADAEAIASLQADATALGRRVGELDGELVAAHAELHALHNSLTMRALAVPRRIYAKLRALMGR